MKPPLRTMCVPKVFVVAENTVGVRRFELRASTSRTERTECKKPNDRQGETLFLARQTKRQNHQKRQRKRELRFLVRPKCAHHTPAALAGYFGNYFEKCIDENQSYAILTYVVNATATANKRKRKMSQRFEFNGEVYLCDEKTLNALRSVRNVPALLALGFKAGLKAGKIVKE